MQNLTYNKAEIIELMKGNRAKHREIFEKAVQNYRVEVIKHLDTMIEDIKAGKTIEHVIRLPRPFDATPEYNSAIRRLELCKDKTIILNEVEFNMYIQDQWGWKHDFVTSNSRYTSTAAVE